MLKSRSSIGTRPTGCWQWLLTATLVSGVVATAPLNAQFDPERVHRQSEAVKQRYPDPPVRFDTPGFAPGRTDFTSHEEMMAFISSLQRRSDNMQVRVVGQSQEGRAIPVLVFSNSRATTAADLLRLNRPVVLLVGLQHGNEPAGGEAMLALARDLTSGPLKALLDRITVVIVPRANPDGAYYFTRSPYANTDINRDHVKVEMPETVALHGVVNEYQPHVFADAHEFSVATRWIEKFGVLQSYDFTLLYATNPNVPRPLTQLAEQLFLRDMRREVERAGYTYFWYYTTSYDTKDKRVAMGGTAADIGRNFAGLQNAVSFLVETRGVGIGRDSYARRVHTHVVAMSSLLATAAENAQQLLETVREVRADLVRRGRNPAADDTIAVTVKQPSRPQKLVMLDPQSAELREIEVEWSDTLAAVPDLARSRPVRLPHAAPVPRSGAAARDLRRRSAPAAAARDLGSGKLRRDRPALGRDLRRGARHEPGDDRGNREEQGASGRQLRLPDGPAQRERDRGRTGTGIARQLRFLRLHSGRQEGIAVDDRGSQRGAGVPADEAGRAGYRGRTAAEIETARDDRAVVIGGGSGYLAGARVADHFASPPGCFTVPSMVPLLTRPTKSRLIGLAPVDSTTENVMRSPLNFMSRNCPILSSSRTTPSTCWYCWRSISS